MSADDDDNELHPRTTAALFGHADAERLLLDAYRGGRVPHAWLIGGPPGIGKATLAYRFARFVLAHPDPAAGEVRDAQTLDVDTDNAAARRIAGQSHPDLLILERVLGDTGKLNRNIKVDQIRKTVSFFGSTAGEGGWRVAIVDSVDELQEEGENALLKILEEPPPRSLMLLVSHAPGRVLATIRSRCRRLILRPLDPPEVASAMAQATGRDENESEIATAAAAASGSVQRGLALLDDKALALRQRIIDQLGRLPNLDDRGLHGLGEAIGGTDPKPLAVFVDVVNDWLSAQLNRTKSEAQKAAQVARIWETVNANARDAAEYNLERKPLVFATFGLLADAARG